MSKGKAMKIAITGSIGSGKSSMGSFLRKQGELVFDTDKMVHDLYKYNTEVYESVVKHFGNSVLNEDKSINRKELGKLVFNDSDEITKLESFVYPEIISEILSYNEGESNYVFYEVPMLFESNMANLFDYIVMVDSDDDIALKRLAQYRKDVKDAKERLALQMDRTLKKSLSNYVIPNNGSLEDFYLKISECLNIIKKELVHDSV